MKVSSKCSEEERRDAYKYIRKKNKRKKKNLTLKTLSRMTNISQSELSKIERGEIYNPSNVFLYRLAKALDVEYNELLRYRWDKYPEMLMKAVIYSNN